MPIFHPPFTIHHYESLDSTNTQLKLMVEAPEFTCLTADEQTAGRGRRDRSWHSAPGEGLYLSVLLRPQLAADQFPLLSLLAAIAVAETVRRFAAGSEVDIKWPNDVLLNGHKVSGILIESFSVPHEPPRVILGIGVNLMQQQFPPELRARATSLLLETGQQISLTAFRNCLLDRLAEWYELLRARRATGILRRWRELSSYASGKFVVVDFDGQTIEGETAGLNEFGALRLRLPNGELRVLLAGEIRQLRAKA